MKGLIVSEEVAADLPATSRVLSIEIGDNHIRLEIEGPDHQLRSVEFDVRVGNQEDHPDVTPVVHPIAAVITLKSGVLRCAVLQRGLGNSTTEVGLRTVRDVHCQGIRTVLRVVKGRQVDGRSGP